MSESEIKLNRWAKVEAMREANVEPFEYTYDVTTSAVQLAADYDGKLEPGEEDYKHYPDCGFLKQSKKTT